MIVKNTANIFTCISRDDFENLVDIACKYENISKEDVLRWYDEHNVILTELCEKWQRSVIENKPDFSVYSDPAYINESFVCWKTYSRRYLQLLYKFMKKKDSVIVPDTVYNVLDLGCGCGYTTVGLSYLFPNAIIHGTNLKGTLQYKIDKDVTSSHSKCRIVDEGETLDLGSIDLVFASEFFEHLDKPIELLDGIIETYRPKFFVFANTFTKMSIGHFNWYYHDNIRYSGCDMSRLFLQHLRSRGYTKVQTGFFNNRPQIYMRNEGFKLGG